ncbi:MAG: helix-turn-helix transcriptional regulator [Clostridia bacterium]|nr:helix-turn-helix transcriptional regulator [Clostridia bacterium]
MLFFYEKHREDENALHITRSRPHEYPAHFHQNLELFILRQGHYSLTVGGVRHELGDGSIALMDSYEVHEYGKGEGDDCVVIIPYSYLARFNKDRGVLLPERSVITDGEMCERLLSIIDGFIIKGASDYTTDAAVELMLSLVKERFEFTSCRQRSETALIKEILSYIQDNYRHAISRRSIAAHLGYTEEHISRVFHRFIGSGIQQYVNTLRYNYIEKCKRDGDTRSASELIFDAGFGSEQTYYRYKRSRKEDSGAPEIRDRSDVM